MLTGRVEPVTRPVSTPIYGAVVDGGLLLQRESPVCVQSVWMITAWSVLLCTGNHITLQPDRLVVIAPMRDASLSAISVLAPRVTDRRREAPPALPSLALCSLIPGRRLSGGVLRGASSQHRLGARPCWFNTLTTGSQRFRTSPSRRRAANTGARAGRPSYRARQCRARTGRARASSTPS